MLHLKQQTLKMLTPCLNLIELSHDLNIYLYAQTNPYDKVVDVYFSCRLNACEIIVYCLIYNKSPYGYIILETSNVVG